jgi:hypothetical protein
VEKPLRCNEQVLTVVARGIELVDIRFLNIGAREIGIHSRACENKLLGSAHLREPRL